MKNPCTMEMQSTRDAKICVSMHMQLLLVKTVQFLKVRRIFHKRMSQIQLQFDHSNFRQLWSSILVASFLAHYLSTLSSCQENKKDNQRSPSKDIAKKHKMDSQHGLRVKYLNKININTALNYMSCSQNLKINVFAKFS